MDDATLKRLAIEEIVREMHEAKQREMQEPIERKVNPLGKPNKRFLGRTINSMITHNKRESDRKRRNCRQKLQELNERADHRMRNKYFNEGGTDRNSCSKVRSNSTISSFSSSEESRKLKERKRKRKKKKRKKKRSKISRSRSCSVSGSKSRNRCRSVSGSRNRSRCRSGSSSRSDNFSKRSSRSKSQYKRPAPETLRNDDGVGYCIPRGEMLQAADSMLNYYNQFNQHYTSLIVANACNHINTFYQYSSMLASAALAEKESKNRESSTRSPSLSLSSLDGGEDSLLSISVSTDNESRNECAAKPRKKRRSRNSTESQGSDVEFLLDSGTDSSSVDENVCINLDSDATKHSSDAETVILTSTSDSEKDFVNVVEATSTSNDHNTNLIDLTEE